MTCPFCEAEGTRIFYDDPMFMCIWDRFPVSAGHALIVPRRHINTWFEGTHQEQVSLLKGIEIARREIEKQYRPDGFNIGINVGAAAGQTVSHLHVHLIPRYVGDVQDPRGGVRYVIADKANYLSVSDVPATYHASLPTSQPGILAGMDVPMLDPLCNDLARAEWVDLAVAFILESGLSRIQSHLLDVLDRGGRIRVVTGDYLDVTEPRALLRLLDMEAAIQRPEVPEQRTGKLECRIFETNVALGFHPKGYLIGRREGERVAYVGSSNLTRAALERGVEWNYRLTQLGEPQAVATIEAEFDRLFHHPQTVPLTEAWIEAYRGRRRVPAVALEPTGVDTKSEKPGPLPEPHRIQREALSALEKARAMGDRAGLVVLATGLGKTWLSAFDSAKFARVLFVAHREEILRQARATFRSIRPEASLGLYTGTERFPEADVLFASVQTLGRAGHLERFAEDTFQYIIIDEFHHAAAATYRRLIDHFEPKFLLGLTATPERTDGADLLALCGENVVYRCDLIDGVNQKLLSPFRYFGIPDEVDFSNIPWRRGRFDPEALENAVATQKRAENAFEQWQHHGGSRTLAFCVSKRHADYMAEFFVHQGVKSVAVHSGPSAAPRTESLEALEASELQVVFSVDMFNEGVDLPHVDTILMLRPTESRILWLQQFGRGLRRAEGKSHVNVIDYIGNHQTFLQPPMILLAGGSDRPGELLMLLERLERGEAELPEGCSVTYELKVLNILKALARPTPGAGATAIWYRSFRERQGERPSASEAWHAGYDPKALRRGYASWYGFVKAEGDLNEREAAALEAHRGFLGALEVTPMTKSYKMLVLMAMLSRESFPGEISIADLASGVQHFAQRSSLLADDLGTAVNNRDELVRLLEQNPISAWCDGRGTGQTSYFDYEDGVFKTKFSVQEEHAQALAELTRELCDYRLAQYLGRLQSEKRFASRIIGSIGHANNRPVIFLPDRNSTPGIPRGWTNVIANNERYSGNFGSITLSMIRKEGDDKNALPDTLRGWFGEGTGQPGTSNRVVLEWKGDNYVMRPVEGRRDGPELWREYMRNEIPALWGYEFNGSRWNQGYVSLENHVFLLVSLQKAGLHEEHQYEDIFLAPDLFQWVSQNQHGQEGKVGQALKHHVERGIQVHLFVRAARKTQRGKAAPFYYCGDVNFVDWKGSKPITIRWQLREPVPNYLRGSFGLSKGQGFV
jgi:superfamily II DNA or RNA helicase/diadenosine tetraphosphate (Ap4A) HIT family hydrolase/HKD family nuclease